ncbi:hypothetical protein E8E13_000145 [Curvularia kusanoi]|uniref:O-methyltransferase C-terminal domain-containing protein n=1 Tax=Curvularia kusanoi TaxID=90978 RepID=A0A9P4T4K7_CURKU|nr:hypothetical protein E8E13_000145 [Curvularia kusanoi]
MKADHVVDYYDWKALGKASVVGGSFGHISVALAKHAPELTFTVQDLPETVEKGKALFDDMILDDTVRQRIRFEPYNLNDTQPATGADVYFFRTIFHNWPKIHCVRFLKNLVPALKPGAKILTNEIVLRRPGALTAWDSRIAHNMEINMITMFNAVERTDDEWRDTFTLADSRFEVVAFRNPKECEGNLFAIVEAVWKA